MKAHKVIALVALLLSSSACAGSDSLTTAPGVAHVSTTDIGQSSGGVSSPGAPSASSPLGASTNSSGPGLTGFGIVSDDFAKYSSTADLLNNITVNAGGTGNWQTSLYRAGLNGNLVELDNTVRYNGHPTMKYNQPGGVMSTPQLFAYFPSSNHIWYRVKVRFSPGFTTTGILTNSSNAYKLISWGWSGADGSGRIEITNTAEYELYENVQRGPALIGGGRYLQDRGISTEWTDGGWYDYIVEVDHSQPVGVLKLWRAQDGKPPVYQGEVQEKMNDGSPMPALNNVAIGLNFNQVRAPGQTQAVWWGEWEVVDGTKHPNPFGVSQ